MVASSLFWFVNSALYFAITLATRKVVDNAGTKLTYSALFEQYVVKNRPFIGIGDPAPLELVPNSCEQITCPIQGELVIPRIAANNYLRPTRFQFSGSPVGSTQYFTQWPASMAVSAAGFSSALRCPAKMNLVTWRISADPSGVLATVQLLKSVDETGAVLAERSRQNDDWAPTMEQYNSSAPEGALDGSFLETANLTSPEQYLFVPHSHVASFQCRSAAVETSCAVALLCMVDASNLNAFRDYLAKDSQHSEHSAALLAAMTSPAFSTAQDRTPADLSLKAYSSPSSVEKEKSDEDSATSADIAVSSSGGGSGSNRRDRRKRGGDFKDWQAQSKWSMLVTSLTLLPPSAPTVAAESVGRSSVEVMWRSSFVPAVGDQTKFGFRILACPLPDLTAALSEHRTGDCFESVHLRGEKSMVGGVSVLREELDNDLLKRTGVEAPVFRSTVSGLLPNTAYHLRVSTLYDQSQSSFSAPCAPLRTASLAVPASVGVADSVALTTAAPSLRFVAAEETVFDQHASKDRTRQVGDLMFPWPSDNGGLPIEGFHVYVRSSPISRDEVSTAGCDPCQDMELAPWRWDGAHPAVQAKGGGVIRLRNLQPGRCYQFKVAAYNALGSALLSPPSLPTELGATKDHVAHGWGHENFLGALTGHFLEHHFDNLPVSEQNSHHSISAQELRTNNFSANSPCSSDMLMLRTDQELLFCTCSGTGERFQLWRSHWTSPHVSVHARASFVDPLVTETSSGQLVSDGAIRGRIVFSPRGTIPFAEKAVRAEHGGALALVVVDDGRCSAYDQQCLPGADKGQSEGFGIEDIKAHWDRVHIPVLFQLQDTYARLLQEAGVQEAVARTTEDFYSSPDEL